MTMNYKFWLDNEYQLWIAALQDSTVHNFKRHPMVKRMLSEVDPAFWLKHIEPLEGKVLHDVTTISEIGGGDDWGRILRMVYHAQQVIRLNASSIREIGGGVGQFCAILRALGYKGDYWIYDLAQVKDFQYKFLNEVAMQTGLETHQAIIPRADLLISFYALGEFDKSTKDLYATKVFPNCDHGYIAWNPHSGAEDDRSIFPKQATFTPGLEAGITIVEW